MSKSMAQVDRFEPPNEETLTAAVEIHRAEVPERALMVAIMVAASYAVEMGLTVPAFRRICDQALKWGRMRNYRRANKIEDALKRGRIEGEE